MSTAYGAIVRPLLVLGSVLLLVACGGGTAPAVGPRASSDPSTSAGATEPEAGAASAAPPASASGTSAASAPVAPTALTVGYAAITAAYIPLWVALDMGAFEKYGLAVELTHLPGNTGPQSLIAGQIPLMTISGFATALSQIEGADLVFFTSAIHRQTATVYGAPGVDTPQAVRGQRLGVTRPGTLTYFAALLALREWGMRPDDDVALVNLNESADILKGLIGGAVDAGVLTDPNSFAAAKLGYPQLADLADVPTEYLHAGMATRGEYARENRSVLLSFLKAYLEGHKRYFDDPALATEVLRKYARIDDPEVLDATYKLYAEKYFVRVPLPTERGMQNILDDYAPINPKAKEIDAARLVDSSLMEQLQHEGFLRSIGLE
ncbi:MAG TPA: ABC transporter substrate-binding protein [Chloroflexota bacterium]